MTTVLSCNVNGIRAAVRHGFADWVATQSNIDVLCLQETKIDFSAHADWLSAQFPGYHCYSSAAQKPGYSGVAIFSRLPAETVKTHFAIPTLDEEGRIVEAIIGGVRYVSLYLPSGTSGADRQAVKMALLSVFAEQILPAWYESVIPTIIAGDWNIANHEIDLKNWRANQNSSGFLPEERRWLDAVWQQGWLDAYRTLYPTQAEYSWWTYRAGARQRNVGWRIDYQVIHPSLRPCLQEMTMWRLPVFSDHAILLGKYQLAR